MDGMKQRAGMKKFYRQAAIDAVEGGFAITLDGRAVRTPERRVLRAPSRALAAAVAAEWNAQGETIEPHSMPLTQLLNTMIDRMEEDRAPYVSALAAYGETDLVCYWAAQPRLLVEAQRAHWQPLLDWAEATYAARLKPVNGALYERQETAAIDALRRAIGALDPPALTVLQAVVPIFGSLVIGLALVAGRLDAETAFAASQVDETYQADLWGRDGQAEARRARLAHEVREAARFLSLMRAG
jgi:chaperone required for assembly of F1-ATPase